MDEVVTDVREEYTSADVSLNTPDEAVSFAAPQLADAVSELLTNAAESGGDDPTIAVAVHPGADRTTVKITDNGFGLPPDEPRILTGASETALEHGSGIGLAIVYWIITNLDGQIDVTTSSSGTTVEVHLQQAASISSE